MRSPRRRADRGETLLELMISIGVLGIVAAGLLAAVSMATEASTMHRRQADATAFLRSWAENVQKWSVTNTGSTPNWTLCPAAGTVTALAPAPPPGVSVTSVTTSVWNGLPAAAFAACSGTSTDTGVQRIRLTVTATPNIMPAFTQSLDVVVRKP